MSKLWVLFLTICLFLHASAGEGDQSLPIKLTIEPDKSNPKIISITIENKLAKSLIVNMPSISRANLIVSMVVPNASHTVDIKPVLPEIIHILGNKPDIGMAKEIMDKATSIPLAPNGKILFKYNLNNLLSKQFEALLPDSFLYVRLKFENLIPAMGAPPSPTTNYLTTIFYTSNVSFSVKKGQISASVF